MANDIPAYDAHDPVPWNTDSGKVAGGTDREGAPLAFMNDLLTDPASKGYDPASGYGVPGSRVSEV
jgi:hypothetical protein